jgi:asparagine synthase (glutamine-hydrolysing)
MCGIAGFIQRERPDPPTIEHMLARLAHRGPDGDGVWNGSSDGWHITLGHRRLAIIDLEGGRQPLANEDGRVIVTFNGEIYNFRSLRADLEKIGHRFSTHSDTEVIVHLCEAEDPDVVQQLDGMFAFAVWDARRERLLLARDRVGIKPLYYAALPDGGVAFASELKALLCHPAVPRELDSEGLSSYFFLDYAHPPHTLVRGVQKLEPAHSLSWECGDLHPPRRYWTLKGEDTRPIDSKRTLVSTLREKLRRSVQAQMMSDVPLGVFLSGGIDSSLVAAIAQKASRERLQTFTIRFDDPQFDESEFARRVAKHIGSKHIEETFTEQRLLETFDEAVDCLDEPIADASLLPTFALSRLAAQHVKVALGGDGGDELWGGYPTYKAHRAAAFYAAIPEVVRRTMIEPVVRRLPVQPGYQRFDWKAKRFALRWADDDRLRHLRWMSNLDLGDLERLSLSIPPGVRTLLDARPTASGLNEILALDFASYLPGAVLTKVDRASMANGLEVRPPLLSNELIDFAFSLPSRMKVHRLGTKLLLKHAAEAWLPRDIIHRKKKGFAIPLSRWLGRGRLRDHIEDILRDSPLWNSGELPRGPFADWNREHQAGTVDRSKPLYALLVLDRWYRSIRSSAPEKKRRPASAIAGRSV